MFQGYFSLRYYWLFLWNWLCNSSRVSNTSQRIGIEQYICRWLSDVSVKHDSSEMVRRFVMPSFVEDCTVEETAIVFKSYQRPGMKFCFSFTVLYVQVLDISLLFSCFDFILHIFSIAQCIAKEDLLFFRDVISYSWKICFSRKINRLWWYYIFKQTEDQL